MNHEQSGANSLPLAGIRVLDATHLLSGPQSIQLLADLGAQVIKIESIQHADTSRIQGGMLDMERQEGLYERSANWIWVNRNKYGLTLNLRSEEGLGIFHRLLATADVVAENLRPGVWERFGLGWEALHAVNPGTILIRLPGYGSTGPWKDHPCYAGPNEQASGFSYFTGYKGEEPQTRLVWEDSAVGLTAAFALVAALHYRRRTGQGIFLDLSQVEVLTALNAEAILDYQLNGRVWTRQGNQSRRQAAPHDCFPCRGDDAWLAIAVECQQQWENLCQVAGKEEWADDPRFATQLDRYRNQDALHALIAEWTRHNDKLELMHRLQKAGVPAAAVLDGLEIQDDPHFWARGLLERVCRPLVGEQVYVGTSFLYDGVPLRTRYPAPLLGEHNDLIMGEQLGLSNEDLEDLERKGIIGHMPENL